jgi:hypothetical protein
MRICGSLSGAELVLNQVSEAEIALAARGPGGRRSEWPDSEALNQDFVHRRHYRIATFNTDDEQIRWLNGKFTFQRVSCGCHLVQRRSLSHMNCWQRK